MKIGILALQGAFAEHKQMLEKLNVESVELRSKNDLSAQFDGIIIPGGESTVQGKLLYESDMLEPLRNMILSGTPVFGTCAGLILLSKSIENDNRKYLRLMNITAVRNAYGRQLGSFYAEADFAGIGKIPMTFIRAPHIKKVGDGAVRLAAVDGKIVAARENNMLVTAFHPELNENTAVHEYFLDMCSDSRFCVKAAVVL